MMRTMNRTAQVAAITVFGALLLLAPLRAEAVLTTDPNSSSMGAVAWGSVIDAPPRDDTPNFQVDLLHRGGRELSILTDIDTRVAGTVGGSVGGPAVGNRPVILPPRSNGFLDLDRLGQVTFGDGTLGNGGNTHEPLQEGLDRFGHRTRGNGRPTGGGQPGDPTNPVPEPYTVMLLASGLMAVATVWTLRRRTLASLRAQG